MDLSLKERRVFNACFGGWALDAMNVQIYSFAIPALIATWGLTLGQAGVLGTAALLVSAVGGWFAGWFADRYGRVRKTMRSFSRREPCWDLDSEASGPREQCCWVKRSAPRIAGRHWD
jgi:hypothetical protein